MSQQLQVGGHTFEVTIDPTKDMCGRYTLRKIGGRGLTYITMRNANRPNLMFLINPNASGPKSVTNLWVSDEGGQLREVTVL